jgi:ribosomal protein S18 acetylase RimI-like enzyme
LALERFTAEFGMGSGMDVGSFWAHLRKMKIVDATMADVEEAAAVVATAFARDPHMAYFFGPEGGERQLLVEEFFSVLMSARLALAMPVMVLKTGTEIAGLVMGYDTRRPDWPVEFEHRWDRLCAKSADAADHFARNDALCEKHKPKEPHYYLGVVGVHRAWQGKGAGRLLIDAFVERSASNSASAGVFIETANPANASWYQRLGFRLLGTEPMDENTTVWCLFKPKP